MDGTEHSAVKPVAIGLYLLLGAAMLWRLQCWHSRRGSVMPVSDIVRRLGAPVLILAAMFLVVQFGYVAGSMLVAAALTSAALFIAINWGRQPALQLAAGAAAAVLPVSLAWWDTGPHPVRPVALAAFAALVMALTLAFRAKGTARRLHALSASIVFGLAATLLLADLGAYEGRLEPLQGIGHHWGAFIGPALHVRAGLVPFYDVPLQYGAGPTALILAFCGDARCWAGSELLFAGTIVIGGILILQMALAGMKQPSALRVAGVTVAVFAAVLFWPGEPHLGAMMLATPSSFGMRFLPVCLVAYLLFGGHARGAALALAAATLWSPEAAAMAIVVYGAVRTADRGFLAAAVETGGITLAAGTAMVLAHRAVFGVWIEPAAFFEYVLHVPGPLPIIPLSNTLVLAAAVLLGGWLIARPAADPAVARGDRVVAMLLFAAVSIWFGRSHPNNVCNLAPFMLLVVLRAIERTDGTPRAAALHGAVATGVATLALSPWFALPFDPAWQLDPDRIAERTRLLEPGIEAIRDRIDNPGGLGIADIGDAMVRHPSETIVWTPLDPASLWAYLPHRRRQLYIERASRRLRRSGYAIFAQYEYPLIRDFSGSYRIASSVRFDAARASAAEETTTHYTVICFDPVLAPGATQVGPRCPVAR